MSLPSLIKSQYFFGCGHVFAKWFFLVLNMSGDILSDFFLIFLTSSCVLEKSDIRVAFGNLVLVSAKDAIYSLNIENILLVI